MTVRWCETMSRSLSSVRLETVDFLRRDSSCEPVQSRQSGVGRSRRHAEDCF